MSMFNKVTKTFQWGPHQVTLETGEIARQSTGAVLVDIEGTVVLATVVARTEAKPGQDFFPLTVDYIEKTYAAGKIPGSFFKREGRPSELETLTSRLIDRPIRPLFPDGFFNEVQVVVHVLSLNPEVQADIAAMIGSSAALAVSARQADDLVARWKPDLIYTNDDIAQSAFAVRHLDTATPIVFSGVNEEPATYGFDRARNVTGVLEREHFRRASQAGRHPPRTVVNPLQVYVCVGLF